MKAAALPLPVVLALACGVASVQARSELRVCLLSEVQQCPDKSSRATAPLLQLSMAGDGWIVSETTSPIDYSPIATATTASRNLEGSEAMQLAIRCRGLRTELALTGPAIPGRGDNYFISYRVNGGQWVKLSGVAATFGSGIAFKGDVVALLQSLPGNGEFAVRLLPLSENELDGIFSLDGLEALRTRIGATCKWPHVIAKPNGR